MKTCGDYGGTTPAGAPCGAPAGRGTRRKTGRCRSHPKEAEDKALTPLQDRFCHEYLIDLNAAGAYRRAGGTDAAARQCAHFMLQKPHVQRRIRELRDTAVKEVGGADIQRVLDELKRLACSVLTDIVDIRNGSFYLRDGADIPADALPAIASLKQTQHGISVTLHDKKGALQLLGQYHALFAERHLHEVKEGTGVLLIPTPVSEDEWSQVARRQQATVAARKPNGSGERPNANGNGRR